MRQMYVSKLLVVVGSNLFELATEVHVPKTPDMGAPRDNNASDHVTELRSVRLVSTSLVSDHRGHLPLRSSTSNIQPSISAFLFLGLLDYWIILFQILKMAPKISPNRRRSIAVLGQHSSKIIQKRRRAYSIVPGEKLSPAARARNLVHSSLSRASLLFSLTCLPGSTQEYSQGCPCTLQSGLDQGLTLYCR